MTGGCGRPLGENLKGRGKGRSRAGSGFREVNAGAISPRAGRKRRRISLVFLQRKIECFLKYLLKGRSCDLCRTSHSNLSVRTSLPDPEYGLPDPRTPAPGTFPRFYDFLPVENEAALPAFGRRHLEGQALPLEAFSNVNQLGLNILRFAFEASRQISGRRGLFLEKLYDLFSVHDFLI